MVGDGQDRHDVSQHLVDHRVRKSVQHSPSIPVVIRSLPERSLSNSVNGVKDLSAESISAKGVPFAVPKKGVSYVALSR